ncbi:MAG: hypothetical protein KIG74_08465 [Clostridiaceae bacterium]|nr:hypothetical protein [Clostridiaceae bacterium]
MYNEKKQGNETPHGPTPNKEAIMPDIHCHILPAIDDGATNLEVSLAMARLSAASGVDTIIATPHFGCDDVNAKSREIMADSAVVS